MTSEGRFAWRDLGNGSDPVTVIFCLGGAGISADVDDSASDSSSSDSDSTCLPFGALNLG